MSQKGKEIADVTGRRVFACLVDYTFLFAATYIYINAFGVPDDEGKVSVQGLPALAPVVLWLIWLVFTEARWGQTIGHALMGLKVVSMDRSKPTFLQIFKRRLCDALEISWCFGLIAFLLVKKSPLRQRLGDMIAHTIVVPKEK